MSESPPAPLVPSDADLRHFATMPLDVQRLRDSDLASVPDADVFRISVLSWCAAWHQLPAGSLPDDDVALARLLGFGRDLRGWKRARAKGALRGWIMCSDGRLYHPVVAGAVHDALHKRAVGARAAWKRWSSQTPQGIDKPQNDECERNADAMPGREGKGRDSTYPSPSLRSGEGSSPSADAAGDPTEPDEPAGKTRAKRVPPEIPEAVLLDCVAEWNAMAGPAGLPQVSELTAARRAKLRARIIGRGWRDDPVRKFRAYCRRISRSPFLCGQGPRGWRAEFDWAVRSDQVVVQVGEGKYDDMDGDGADGA